MPYMCSGRRRELPTTPEPVDSAWLSWAEIVMADVIEAEFVCRCVCPACGAYESQLSAENLCTWCIGHCTVATARGRMLVPLEGVVAAHRTRYAPASPEPVVRVDPAQLFRFARQLAVAKWGARNVARAEKSARQATDGLEIVVNAMHLIQGRGSR